MTYQKYKLVTFSVLLSFSNILFAARNFYVSKQFVHLHKNQSINSLVTLTLSCGQKVKLISRKDNWIHVATGSYKGHVLARNFTKVKPKCFSHVHKKLYNKIDLDMREVYKLGRLEDLFIYGEPEL